MADKENCLSFYAISVPIEMRPLVDSPDTKLVFTDKRQVLEAVKKLKGSRFKAFDNLNDAILFTKEVIVPEVDPNDNNNRNIEKSLSPFSGLHPRELAKLRKAIQSDDHSAVEQMIWSNPRYLVSSGDTPVILMEGPRYNACHIAAKDNRHNILRLILKTVSNRKFWKLLYPSDSNDITESRLNFLLDLYLNTPEKGFCETPLHFGCKFGSSEAVAVLLGYPMCDIDKVNKNGQKASQIICERKGDKNVEKAIRKHFEQQTYIPLIRDDFSAQIGRPYKGSIGGIAGDVAAVAGPMSPEQAEQLYRTLKSPHKCTPSQRKIRLTDSRKGLERIARNLCQELDINFIEFWPFLNTSLDLRSDEGLELLEKHLRNVYYQLDSESNIGEEGDTRSGQLINDSLAEDPLTNQMMHLSLNSSLTDEDLHTNSFVAGLESDQIVSQNDLNANSSGDESQSDCSFVSACSSAPFLYDFYINGPKVSKEDIDAALALQYIISTDRCLPFEFIQNWFNRIADEEPQHFELSDS